MDKRKSINYSKILIIIVTDCHSMKVLIVPSKAISCQAWSVGTGQFLGPSILTEQCIHHTWRRQFAYGLH